MAYKIISNSEVITIERDGDYITIKTGGAADKYIRLAIQLLKNERQTRPLSPTREK